MVTKKQDTLIKKFILTAIALFVSCSGSNLPHGTWTQKADFGGSIRNSAVGFSIGSKGYIGTGYDGSYSKDFWEYNPALNTWTQKADFGGSARKSAVGFSIGSKGYIGTGYDGSYSKDFWEYNPALNTWIQKADFSGAARDSAVGFSIGSKGYIGTGYDGSYYKDFWEYDPAKNIWNRKADFGGTARYSAIGFSIGSKCYIGTGSSSSYCKDFWEYDPVKNIWNRKADFGGPARNSAVGFSAGSKGYIGTGYDGSYYKDFWEYDPAKNIWNRKADFGGSARYGAVGFSIGTKRYIGTGYYNVLIRDFWAFDPGGISKNPKQFIFTDQMNVASKTTVTSNTVTVSGIDAAAPVSITGGKYSINKGDYTSDDGTVKNGDTITVQLTSSESSTTTSTATLTIGDVSAPFNVTTQFIFTDQTKVALNAAIKSNTMKVSGFNAAQPISITGGTYSINGGPYTDASGTVNNGDTVTVQLFSSESYSTITSAKLTIGSVSDTFDVATKEAPGSSDDIFVNSKCFIATAVFDSPMAGQVEILRQFRDKYLLTNDFGRKFVAWYYRNGPAAAKYIKDKPLVKATVRVALYPLIGFSLLLFSGYFPLLIVGLLLPALLFFLFRPKKLNAN
jgi:hypothetical protein